MSDSQKSAIQSTTVSLLECGIKNPIAILGKITRLVATKNAPIVFLIDENHEIIECIRENIVNANELISKCDVRLIGVESHSGGDIWSERFRNYVKDLNDCDQMHHCIEFDDDSSFDSGESTQSFSAHPEFADAMRSSSGKVVGVECVGLFRQLESDTAVGGSGYGKPISENHWNLKRSEHFLRTLFKLREIHDLSGNMILNAGGNHNSHIAMWIDDGTITAMGLPDASYIRLTAPAYQE